MDVQGVKDFSDAIFLKALLVLIVYRLIRLFFDTRRFIRKAKIAKKYGVPFDEPKDIHDRLRDFVDCKFRK